MRGKKFEGQRQEGGVQISASLMATVSVGQETPACSLSEGPGRRLQQLCLGQGRVQGRRPGGLTSTLEHLGEGQALSVADAHFLSPEYGHFPLATYLL